MGGLWSKNFRKSSSGLEIISHQETLRNIVDVLTVLVEDVKFKFEKGHMEVRAVDRMQVAMVRIEIDAQAFEAWECEPCTIGFELAKLRDLIELAKPDDSIEMHYDKKDGRVNIQVGDVQRSIRSLDRSAMLEPRVPGVHLTSSVKMSPYKFKRALRAAKQVGDLATISLNAQSFGVNVSGDTDTVNVSYDAGELEDLVCGGPVKSQYSLSLLYPMVNRIESIWRRFSSDFIKSDFSKQFVEEGYFDGVWIYFNENHPIRLEFTFAHGAARCVYFLAPRIEGDA